MTGPCPACAGYTAPQQRQMDKAGADHAAELAQQARRFDAPLTAGEVAARTASSVSVMHWVESGAWAWDGRPHP